MNAPFPTLGIGYRPIGGQWHRTALPRGLTLVDYAALLDVPDELRPYLGCRINGQRVPREWWPRIRPLAGNRDVFINFEMMLAGGGGGGGKTKIFSILGAIALLGASAFTGGAGFAGIGAALKAAGPKLLLGALSIGASLVMQGLQPKPEEPDKVKQLGFASAGNNFAPMQGMQRVVGSLVRVAPDLVLPTFTELEGDDLEDQAVYALFALAGRTDWGIIRHGDIDVTNTPDLEYETRDGSTPSDHLTLITDTPIERQVNITLSEWKAEADDDHHGFTELSGTVEQSEPVYHRVETRTGPDYFRIELVATAGMLYSHGPDPDDEGDTGVEEAAGVFLRCRMRRRDEEAGYPDDPEEGWTDLPNLLVKAKNSSGKGMRVQWFIRWVDSYPSTPPVDPGDPPVPGNAWPPTGKEIGKVQGWRMLYPELPGSDAFATSVGTDAFAEWAWDEKQITLYLLTSAWPKGRYQFELKRSWPIRMDHFDPGPPPVHEDWAAYSYFEAVSNDAGVTFGIPNKLEDFRDDLVITSVQSRFPDYPVSDAGNQVALLAVKLKNAQLGPVTADAGGVTEVWNGSSWGTPQVTANPAAWDRAILKSAQNAEPVDDALIDGAFLADWFEWCAANGKEVNAVIRSKSVVEARKIVHLCGFSSPNQGAPYGGVIDRERTGGFEGLITHVNAASFGFRKPFPRRPHALYVTFLDRDNDFEAHQLTVYAEGYNADGADGLIEAVRFEAVNYDGITDEVQATDRADRDLAWMKYRSLTLPYSMDVENLEFLRGARVKVSTDILGEKVSFGRVRNVEVQTTEDGELIDSPDLLDEYDLNSLSPGVAAVSAITINAEPRFGAADLELSDISDLLGVVDLLLIGAPRAATIRLRTGEIVTAEVSDFTEDGRIVFADPLAKTIVAGDVVATGAMGKEARDMLIWDIAPGRQLTADLIAIDYAGDAIYRPGRLVDFRADIDDFNEARVRFTMPAIETATGYIIWRTGPGETFADRTEVDAAAADPGDFVELFDTLSSDGIYKYWGVAVTATGLQSRVSGPRPVSWTGIDMAAIASDGTLADIGGGVGWEL